MPYVVEAVFGNTAGRIMLVDVIIAICVCTLACQTSGSRMMFSMARDRVLPCAGEAGVMLFHDLDGVP